MTGSRRFSAADRVLINGSKSRRVHVVIISGLLFAVGVGSLVLGKDHVPDHRLVGFVCGGIALAVIIALRGAWAETVALTIDEEGLWYADWKLPLVPWCHIGDVYTTGIRLRPLLRINLENSVDFFQSLNTNARGRIRENNLVRIDHLLIPNGALEISIKDLIPLINDFSSRAGDH